MSQDFGIIGFHYYQRNNMGYNTAVDLSENLDLETSLRMHLRGNHYPPVPVEMVPICIEAIELAKEELWDEEIQMPLINDFQVMYKNRQTAPVWAIIEQHHLQAWLEGEDE